MTDYYESEFYLEHQKEVIARLRGSLIRDIVANEGYDTDEAEARLDVADASEAVSKAKADFDLGKKNSYITTLIFKANKVAVLERCWDAHAKAHQDARAKAHLNARVKASDDDPDNSMKSIYVGILPS